MTDRPRSRLRDRLGSSLARLIRGRVAGTVPGGHDGMFARRIDAPLLATTSTLPELPLVSVVMTCHDTLRYLDDAVASILGQTWRHLELIVVDDASQDGSLDRLHELASTDDRLRIIPLTTNTGTYRAKNIGMHNARGEVLTFMDSDDTSHHERIERQLRLLREPGLVATTCNYVRRTGDGEVVLNRGLRERQALISLMIKRAVVDDVGWFDSVRTSADDEFFERIRDVYGRKAHINLDNALYVALSREHSLSTSAGNAVDLWVNDSVGTSSLSSVRQAYVAAYREWHARTKAAGMRPYMPHTLASGRPFPAAPLLTA